MCSQLAVASINVLSPQKLQVCVYVLRRSALSATLVAAQLWSLRYFGVGSAGGGFGGALFAERFFAVVVALEYVAACGDADNMCSDKTLDVKSLLAIYIYIYL